MSVDYSFKHHFNWPSAASVPGAAPIPPASAFAPMSGPGPLPYTHYGYAERRMFRPRFGFFRRFFWFGLGVGAASWYIHRKQEWQRMIETGNIDPAECKQWGWRNWQNGHHHPSPSPSTAPIAGQAAALPQSNTSTDPRVQLWGKSPTTPSPPTTQPNTPSTDDIAALRATLDRMVHDKAREAGNIQAKVQSEAREYARDKLERLSVVLEGLKESLKVDAQAKEKKLV